MSSILTNSGAMVALQTLKSVNARLAGTQNEISTGKSVASAKDNAAVWAISKIMESDVKGFEAISSSLSLGDSTMAVASNAAESITDTLIEIKEKIVAAQEDNVDRAKLQTDITALRDQIASIADAAQFNGLNLLSNTSTTAGSGTMSVLSALDRATDGSVTARHILVEKQDLAPNALSLDVSGTHTSGTAGTISALLSANVSIGPVTAGAAFTLAVDQTGTTGAVADTEGAAGSPSIASLEAEGLTYVSRESDTAADVALALKNAWDIYAAHNNIPASDLSIEVNSSDGLTVTSEVTNGVDTIAVDVGTISGTHEIGGGLGRLDMINVSSASGAVAALIEIEPLIQIAADSAAVFGSAAGRIKMQASFTSQLTDVLTSGIGALVDADMEAASARLKALQTQQQLGVQALSIANSAPQQLTSLFR